MEKNMEIGSITIHISLVFMDQLEFSILDLKPLPAPVENLHQIPVSVTKRKEMSEKAGDALHISSPLRYYLGERLHD